MPRYCIICGHQLITEGNDMLSDICGIDLDDIENAMITYAHCPDCGCDYIMQDASNKENGEDPTYVGQIQIFQNNETIENG